MIMKTTSILNFRKAIVVSVFSFSALFSGVCVHAQLFQHLDASVESWVNTDASNNVTSWNDLSGNENHAIASSGNAIYPSSKTFDNGLNAIDMRGGSVSLELLSSIKSDVILNQAANPTGFCIIVALYIDSFNATWNDIIGNNSSISSGFFMRYSEEGKLQTSLGGSRSNGSGIVKPGEPVILSFNYNAIDRAYQYWCSSIDEELIAEVDPADFSNSNPLTIGATSSSSRYFEGMVGEVLIYDQSISKEMRTEKIYELGAKWGVELPRIPAPPTTQIVETKWSDDDLAIIGFNAAEAPYNADKTGATDATQAIQHALDDCAKAPGGVVYLPEGIYKIDGNLEIADGVILRGDWKEPSENDKTVAGTVLYIYGGKGGETEDASEISPILLGSSSGIRDLSIFYPEQDASSPVAYPSTIRCNGKMQTVMNITLVNSYKGIRFEPYGSSVGHPYVYNVYGFPLKKGIRLNHAVAVPRIDEVHFEPSYWAESGLPGAPGEAEAKQAVRGMSSVAIELAHSDNGIIGKTYLKGYDIAIQIVFSQDDNPNGSNMKVYDFDISQCRQGINAVGYKAQGWIFTFGSIQVDGDGAIAVSQSGQGLLTFNDVELSSTGKMVESTIGRLSFTNCRFLDWDSDYGISMADGHLISFGNIFSKTLETGQSHIYLAAGTDAAAISGNTFENSPAKIVSMNNNKNVIVIDTTGTYDVYRHNYESHPKPKYFKPAIVDTFFNVQDYGAVGNMTTENTNAFKAALKAAEENGGGTVYVPGGAYRINGNLLIPTGVELRGVHDVPVYTGGARSILLSYVDEDNPGDSAFISLQTESSLRGLCIIRPQQMYNEFDNSIGTTIHDWPYAIRTLGDNCSIVNIALANADKGIDLASTGSGHYINWYMVASLGVALNAQTGIHPITIDNMQTNPYLYFEIKNRLDWSVFTDSLALITQIKRIAPNPSTEGENLWPVGIAANVAGDGEINFYSNFYNNCYEGFIINGSPKMTTLLSGGEGDNFYKVESEGSKGIELTIIANTYHPISDDMSKAGFGWYHLNEGSTGVVKVLNTTSFGRPDIGYRIVNGKLIIQSAFQTSVLQTFVEAKGDAVASVQGSYLYRGMSGYHGVAYDETASVEIHGTYSLNNYFVFGDVDVSGSTPATVLEVDRVKPSTPLNLVANAVSATQIDLSWEPSTDNLGVTGYNVYRNGVKVAQLSTTSYSNTGLVANTSYDFNVTAFDAASNESDQSETISMSTLVGVDTEKPSVPLNVVANAVSATQIDLSWEPSTDNVEVAGYNVYRNGEKVIQLNTTSYSDTGLVANTSYDYNVAAIDAASNESDQSETISMTTLVGVGKDYIGSSEMIVFPNPSEGQLWVTLPESIDSELSFELYSLDGTLIRSEKLYSSDQKTKVMFDISNLNNGLYLYRFKGSGINSIGKIMLDKN